MHHRQSLVLGLAVSLISACNGVAGLTLLGVISRVPTESQQVPGGAPPASLGGELGLGALRPQTPAAINNGLRATLDTVVLSIGEEKALAPTLRTASGLIPV